MDIELFQENEDLKIEGRREKGCRLSLKIEIKPKKAQNAYKKAIKLINKEISLPGFRKGKAPEDVVVAKYSAHIEKEWKEILIQEAFDGALSLIKIYPLNKKSFDKPKIEKASRDEGATILIAYEHYPEVPSINFADIKLPKVAKAEIEESQIEEVLSEVKRAHATWEDVTGRKVKEGDYVDLSIDKIEENPETPPSQLAKERRFEVSKSMIPWLKKAVTGLEIGAVVETTTEPSPTATEKELKEFQPINVRITLHSIKKSILPELSDELAVKAGAASQGELLLKIRGNLEKEMEAKQKEEKIRLLEKKLLEIYHFDLPATLVQREIEARAKRKAEDVLGENASADLVEQEAEKIKGEMAIQVDEALRLYFLFEELAQRGKVALTNEEINEKLTREIYSNPFYYQLSKTNNNELLGKVVSQLKERFYQEKVREYALAQLTS